MPRLQVRWCSRATWTRCPTATRTTTLYGRLPLISGAGGAPSRYEPDFCNTSIRFRDIRHARHRGPKQLHGHVSVRQGVMPRSHSYSRTRRSAFPSSVSSYSNPRRLDRLVLDRRICSRSNAVSPSTRMTRHRANTSHQHASLVDPDETRPTITPMSCRSVLWPPLPPPDHPQTVRPAREVPRPLSQTLRRACLRHVAELQIMMKSSRCRQTAREATLPVARAHRRRVESQRVIVLLDDAGFAHFVVTAVHLTADVRSARRERIAFPLHVAAVCRHPRLSAPGLNHHSWDALRCQLRPGFRTCSALPKRAATMARCCVMRLRYFRRRQVAYRAGPDARCGRFTTGRSPSDSIATTALAADVIPPVGLLQPGRSNRRGASRTAITHRDLVDQSRRS